MVSSPRNLLVACCLALACLPLTGSAYGQIYGQQASSNSGSIQSYDSRAIIDHSSMSPDSWSAPTTVGSPIAVLPDTGFAPFQPSTNNTFSPTRAQANSSPSIPDLNATAAREPANQANSLIRQPGVGSGNSNNAFRSPFQSATYGIDAQGGSSSTSTSPTTNPVIMNDPPSTNSTLAAPVTSSPALGQPITQVAPGRYPLSINGSLPAAASTTGVPPDNPATTYQALTTGTQIGSTRYPNYGAAVSQSFLQQPLASSPSFRPDLGHRDPNPTFRGREHDSGLKMDFEDKKKEYPGLGEILATGRYFGSASALYLQPAFQNSSAITQFNSSAAGASFVSSESFDFDYETAPRLRLGFESKFGPGVELDYFQFDDSSNISSFTSNGLNSGQLSTGLFGPSGLTTLEAVNAGEQLSAIHSIDVETFSIMFFKEIKFPISRLNGMFGFQYASIFQTLEGELTNAGGAVIGSLRSTSDLRAYGPKFKFEYYRPVGHTKLEFVTAFGGGVLFGERDQIVSNTGTPAVNRFGADEFVLLGDFYGGVQWKKMTAENRAYYVRLGVTHQSWIGGGTAVSAQDNFGLRGFSFEAGLNR